MIRADDDSAADDLLLTALTQLARERLINAGIFPASRPELADQLRALENCDGLAALLESVMFGDIPAAVMLETADQLIAET